MNETCPKCGSDSDHIGYCSISCGNEYKCNECEYTFIIKEEKII